MANAGHTAVNTDGEAFVAKALPCPAIMQKWTGHVAKVIIGPSAAFHTDRMVEEIGLCGLHHENVIIHPRAGVITDEHRKAETDLKTGTKHIASTMQGCGTFLADKIMRRKELKLARDYDELSRFIPPFLKDESLSWTEWIVSMMTESKCSILHEGSQGFSLDINYGSHYPACTSRSTTATQNITDMGLPASMMGEVILVIRPYPIRVGNVVEDGKTVGYSGDCYNDHEEISWDDVAKDAGAPEHVMKGELTTVTKRLRRVFTFSERQIREAVIVNGATQIALNFANYIDWDCFEKNSVKDLSDKVLDFVKKVEDIAQRPVTLIGTGPRVCNVVDLKYGPPEQSKVGSVS
jgi:adenylosuccinate synthase